MDFICIHTFKLLIKITTGNHIIARFVFFLQLICQHPALNFLSFSTVIRFQMKIDQHQFFVCSLNRNPCLQHAAFQITCFDRPGKRFCQFDTLCTLHLIICHRNQTCFDFSDRRNRIRHKITLEITGINAAHIQGLLIIRTFIDMERTLCINIHFLKKIEVRSLIF